MTNNKAPPIPHDAGGTYAQGDNVDAARRSKSRTDFKAGAKGTATYPSEPAAAAPTKP